MLSSYEAVREIFKLDDSNRDRYVIPFVEDRNYGKSLGKENQFHCEFCTRHTVAVNS